MRFAVGVSLVTAASGFSPNFRWSKAPLFQLAAPPIPAAEADELPNPAINWFAPLRIEPEIKPSPGSIVYPLFPLGYSVYLPNTQHVLNIFEPRYRKMYNDILLSGSRSFAVCLVDGGGRFSETASIFYLEDLKEVSEQTKDKVKYVCQHKCTKRVKIKKVLNPAAWTKDTSNYLRIEVDEIVDDGTPPSAASALAPSGETSVTVDAAEVEAAAGAVEAYTEDIAALCSDMDRVVEMMNSFSEEPRFSPQLKGVFYPEDFVIVGPEGDSKVWAMASLWQTFASERVNQVQRKGTAEIQAKIMAHVTKNGTISTKSLAGRQLTIPPSLEKDIARMTKRVRAEMEEKMDATTLPFQQLLQTASRGERVRLLRRIVLEEKRRLDAKQSLRALFGGEESRGEDGEGSSEAGEEKK